MKAVDARRISKFSVVPSLNTLIVFHNSNHRVSFLLLGALRNTVCVSTLVKGVMNCVDAATAKIGRLTRKKSPCK